MYIASDENNRLCFIENAVLGRKYICPICLGELSPRLNGEKRQHCFAHMPGKACSDTWARDYEMSEWHRDWQSVFPIINQEVVVALGYIRHRADVLTGTTVIEFQHSIMSAETFNNRNAFYHDLGYKVVWLFDLTDETKSGKLNYKKKNGKISFEWANPKRAFSKYEIAYGEVDLYFQVNDDGEDCIIKVDDSIEEFKQFSAITFLSKEQFVSLFMIGGNIPEPSRGEIIDDAEYKEFKRRYNVILNDQQERAVLAVDGAVLVLAVPGSGKTTTLIARIGYMVKLRGIKGENILALTYTKSAAEDMTRRYSNKFGNLDGVEFRTINSLGYDILNNNGYRRIMADNKTRTKIIRDIYKELFPYTWPTETDLKVAGTTISYIKNMMLEGEEIKSLLIWDKCATEIYDKYCAKLDEGYYIDFDDQVVKAYELLKQNEQILETVRSKYSYICVDEAQDTSKIQYELIKLLVGNKYNIFMVGDEDQSIYRFRAAYPEGMLNFKQEYPNPHVLRIEKNYRSTVEIVDVAAEFIARNKKRVPKVMVSQNGNGKIPQRIVVKNREEQYKSILEQAQKASGKQVAFLYRENSCVLPAADKMIKAGIGFSIKKSEDIAFFHDHVVNDIKAFMTLADNPSDVAAFKQIYAKCGLYIKQRDCDGICNKVKYERKTVSEAMKAWLSYGNRKEGHKADQFERIIKPIGKMRPAEAIDHILKMGYSDYLNEKGMGRSHAEILQYIARDDDNIQGFFHHLGYLENTLKERHDVKSNITLSTIHSSKGLEYDSVYIMDVYDGMIPAMAKEEEGTEEDRFEQEQEERRLFYVAMTRAKSELYFYNITNRDSSFLREIFRYSDCQLQDLFDGPENDIYVLNTRCNKTYMIHRYYNMYSATEIDTETGEIGETISDEVIRENASCFEWKKIEC